MTQSPEAAPMPPAPAQQRNPFAPAMTAVFAAGWLLVMFQGWGGHIGSNPTAWLYDPASTAARIVNRDLEMAEVLGDEGALAAFHEAYYGTREDALEYALSVQRDAAREVRRRVELGYELGAQRTRSDLRTAVLLAETGALEDALDLAAKLGDADLQAAFQAIYTGAPYEPTSGAEPLSRLAEAGLEDWLLERAAIHLLENRGANEDARAIEDEIAARGRRSLTRVDLLNAANAVLILFGIAVAIVWLRTRPPLRRSFDVPWSAGLGFAVIVRADFWNRLYFVSLAQAGVSWPDAAWLAPFYTWGTLLASLPMLWLITRYLTPPREAGRFDFFLGTRPAVQLLAVALIALAIDLLGTQAIAWSAWSIGLEGHWAEGLDETLIWGSTREIAETVVDYVIWTPLFEELMFRGLVFATLRTRFGAVNSALMSAAFFSAIHFYSLPGFLVTFWSGFVWALAFERARSLLPGVFAHAVYNLFFVLGIVLVYR